MSLTLFYHPLASFCLKVLIPLYEKGTAFTPRPGTGTGTGTGQPPTGTPSA